MFQAEWREEVKKHFEKIKSEGTCIHRLDEELIRRRRDELRCGHVPEKTVVVKKLVGGLLFANHQHLNTTHGHGQYMQNKESHFSQNVKYGKTDHCSRRNSYIIWFDTHVIMQIRDLFEPF